MVDSIDTVVRDLLLSKNSGVDIITSKYEGSFWSIGIFNCHLNHSEFIDFGLILSTGNILRAVGPNTETNMGSKTLEPGAGFLSELAGSNTTLDAAVLAFDFKTNKDSFCFKYIFASEEYPEYVNRGVNDVFAFVLIDMENGQMKNIATLPDGKTPICVDEINHLKNQEYFYLNGQWEPENPDKWKNDSIKGETALHIQFDGFTKVLNAGAKVIPNRRYRLILAISDVGDDVYDSAIFLQANSFSTQETNDLKRLLINLEINADGSFSGIKNLNFDFASAQLTDKASLTSLDSLAWAIEKYRPKQIEIIGHTDSVGSIADNQLLSEQRAAFVKGYLANYGIDQKMIITQGKGELEPINPKKPQLNRRVEFVFSY
jgi:outer membrane protein OmpA-like peptidoglycan-associated protein